MEKSKEMEKSILDMEDALYAETKEMESHMKENEKKIEDDIEKDIEVLKKEEKQVEIKPKERKIKKIIRGI